MFKRKQDLRSQEEKRRETHIQGIRPEHLLLLPNLLTISRILITIPAIYYILNPHIENSSLIAAVILMFGFLTDTLDGTIARVYKLKSDLGKILDPVVDKFVIFCVAASLTFTEREIAFPLWLFLMIIVKDFLILLFAMKVMHEDHHLFTSGWVGKLTTFVIAITLLSYLLFNYIPEALLTRLPPILAVLMIVSGVDYLERYLSVRHKKYEQRTKSDG